MCGAKHWASEKWWLDEEYTRLYSEKISPNEVDRIIERVAKVFDAKWQRDIHGHPILARLLSKGTVPLESFLDFGTDLLTADGCLRLPSLIKDLRHQGNYESARFELGVAAHLKREGHQIELRPPLPNRREADFVARIGNDTIYFEIKCPRHSERQLALNRLSDSITFAVSDLIRESAYPRIKGKHYEIELSADVSASLGKGREVDQRTIAEIAQRVIQEISERAEQNLSLEFVIPSVATIAITEAVEEGSFVTWPMTSSESEIRRILSGHLSDALDQLHPEHAGMILVQTPAGLEIEVAQTLIHNFLVRSGKKAAHVSAVLILPLFNWFPRPWALFKPFIVLNHDAIIPASSLKALTDLRLLLTAELSTPSEE